VIESAIAASDLVKLFSDCGEAQRYQKEIEGIQRPAKNPGGQRCAVIGKPVVLKTAGR